MMTTLRELDLLVDKHVMGHSHVTWVDGEPIAVVTDGDSTWSFPVPRYSTDIAAAWIVLSAMQKPEMDDIYTWYEGFQIRRGTDGLWVAGHIEGIPHEGSDFIGKFTASAVTAPLAICKAALKIKGISLAPFDLEDLNPRD